MREYKPTLLKKDMLVDDYMIQQKNAKGTTYLLSKSTNTAFLNDNSDKKYIRWRC